MGWELKVPGSPINELSSWRVLLLARVNGCPSVAYFKASNQCQKSRILRELQLRTTANMFVHVRTRPDNKDLPTYLYDDDDSQQLLIVQLPNTL